MHYGYQRKQTIEIIPRERGKTRNCAAPQPICYTQAIWISASFNKNWGALLNSKVGECSLSVCLRLSPISFSLQKCILCLSELGDHFLSYMPRWLLEFLAPRKLEGKKKSNIYRMLRLISWNGGIWSEEVENPRSPPLSPPPPNLTLHPSSLLHGGSKILGAERQWQGRVAMHKLKAQVSSSLIVRRADNAPGVITFHR